MIVLAMYADIGVVRKARGAHDAAPLQHAGTAVAAPDPVPCAVGAQTGWERATEAQRTAAAERMKTVRRANALAAEGHTRANADAIAGLDEGGVSASTVGAWRARVKRAAPGQALEALIDRPRPGRPPGNWSGAGAKDL